MTKEGDLKDHANKNGTQKLRFEEKMVQPTSIKRNTSNKKKELINCDDSTIL